MVATIYEKNEEYQEAKDILLLAFERAPIGKRLLFKLAVEEALMGNLVAAGMDVALDTLRKTRVRCVKEVRETNGEIDMDDALAYQKGV